VIECVPNVSEGRRSAVVAELAALAGRDLLDVHTDPDHHRSVLTLAGEHAVRAVTRRAVEVLDLRTHHGAHPRIGVVDVVPFVALEGSTPQDAQRARDDFADFAAGELEVPVFLYGPERTLPDIRRQAWTELAPDLGPDVPHPTAGAICVGVREVLVAYNVWLAEPDLAAARAIARSLRGPAVRALGLAVGDRVQVSVNLVRPDEVGPAQVYDAVAARAVVARAELVGLVPARVLQRIDPARWDTLDLAPERTIEWRLRRRAAT
jgi:glutamate formiminotransferase